ncbi:MAG: DNA-3-methyladenine glycosylase I [Thermoanaerobaculaceae bacterium]|jgi:DNA-3-methyladenine glycosylase I|nr:DNA-3-methyladenine glycosylase I [Thermoanaerobaculaceae bacterium]
MERCPWAGSTEGYQRYHDEDWGVPTHDDRRHFEFLVLESAQAGLSWETILRKREGYRRAFADFDPAAVARFDDTDVARLLADTGIVRNRLKIASAIGNARAFLDVQREFGSFDAFVWPFVGGTPIRNAWTSLKDLPVFTPQAEALSKELKRRGFRFVGPTVVYSHMQACGLVNDHLVSCFRYGQV